jgi:transcription antitermination factor NusB
MKVKSRRRAREVAMRTLYECEITGSALDDVLSEAADAASMSEDLAEYSRILVHGVADHQEELDSELNELLVKYDLMRLAALDRNILRMGAFEIAHIPYVPPKVSLNEAIEIAKKYSTAESGKFINGVLGKFMERGGRVEYAEEIEEEPSEIEVVEVEERTLEEGSKEAEEVRRRGGWKIRADHVVMNE